MLRTLRKLASVDGEKIIHMDDLRDQHPEKFTESGQMDWKWFEKEIRPNYFIYARHDKNSLSFTLQNGPVKENGKNGCQVNSLISLAKTILIGLNDELPCKENVVCINSLDQALLQLDRRTVDRTSREVQGTNAP